MKLYLNRFYLLLHKCLNLALSLSAQISSPSSVLGRWRASLRHLVDLDSGLKSEKKMDSVEWKEKRVNLICNFLLKINYCMEITHFTS